MIQLTPTAASKAKDILEVNKDILVNGGLRVYVQGGGCSGFSYGMSIDEIDEDDEVFDFEGVKVMIDHMSLKHLDNAIIDYKEVLLGGGFVVNNPNAKSTCGCGSSFS